MHRLSFILGLSHLLMCSGSVALYVQPSVVGAIAIPVGAFFRWMIPYRNIEKEDGLRTYLKAGVVGLLVKWLADIGLFEFLEEAWSERFSVLPILAFILALLYLVVSDWIRFLKLSPEDLDKFYDKKEERA